MKSETRSTRQRAFTLTAQPLRMKSERPSAAAVQSLAASGSPDRTTRRRAGEYFVDYSRDDGLDENGDLIQSDETIRLLEISILPRSASTSFAKAGLPLGKEFCVSLDVEI